MPYRTIVVGTDGSPTATVAVGVAQALARRLRGKLVLVGALDAYGVSRQPLQAALYDAAEAARAKKVDATAELIEGTPGESILAAALASVYAGSVTLVHVGDPLVGAIKLDEVATAKPEDVEVQRRAVEGDPAQVLCDLAESEDAQLVVVGNKGMSGVRRFLGSVPNKVAHEVPSDVLIVKTVDRSVDDLLAGHGGIVLVDGKQLAVYRADDGSTFELSPRC